MGINWNVSNETSNDIATADVDLPWLQDEFSVFVQNSWNAVYRDVLIVDPQNRKVGVAYNLTSQSLAIPANREALKSRLRNAAVFQDSDNDGLGDDWEQRWFGGLDQQGETDSDGDGESLSVEYAFGNMPGSGAPSGPEIEVSGTSGNREILVRHRRRIGAGDRLVYSLQRLLDNGEWTDVSDQWSLDQVDNPYDGTGTEIVTLRSPAGMNEVGVYRVVVRTSDSN